MERGDDAAQPFGLGVDPYDRRLAQRPVDRRRPEPVAGADDRGTDVVHAPAPGLELERERSPFAAPEPETDRRPIAVEPRGGRQVNLDARAATQVVDGERRAQAVSFQDAVMVEPQVAPQRGRATGQSDRDQQRERRGQHGELCVPGDEGRHQRRRGERRVQAQPHRH